LCEKYLPTYYKAIGGKVEDYTGLMFIYYFIERTIRKPYMLKEITAQELIDGFHAI
jgi:hypothetical protein